MTTADLVANYETAITEHEAAARDAAVKTLAARDAEARLSAARAALADAAQLLAADPAPVA